MMKSSVKHREKRGSILTMLCTYTPHPSTFQAMLSPYYSGRIGDVHRQTIGMERRRVWPIESTPFYVLEIDVQYRYMGVVPFKRPVCM